MKSTEVKDKIVILIAVLFSGIFLFLTFTTALIGNTVFNNRYHISTLSSLGLQNYIAETARIKSSEIFPGQEQVNLYIASNLSPEIVNKNIESLVTGLLDYIKGKSSNLPDLYLRGSQTYKAGSSAEQHETSIPGNSENHTDNADLLLSSFSKLTSIEKINLRLFVMFSDEQKINSILLAISKAHFFINNFMVLSILLYLLIFTIALRRKPSDFLIYCTCSAINYTALSILACIFLYGLRNNDLPYIISILNISVPDIREILNNYTLSFLDDFIYNLFLNSVIFTLGSIIICCIMKKFLQGKNSFFKNTFISAKIIPFKEMNPAGITHRFCKGASLLYRGITVMLISALCTHLNIAVCEYFDRGFDHSGEYLAASASNDLIIDARNHDICYLDIIVLDSVNHEPLEGTEVIVYKADSFDLSVKRSFTDSEGSSPFLLEKGSYRLILDTAGTQTDRIFPDAPNLTFDLLKPGKNELKVFAEVQSNGHISIKSSAVQYLP